MIPRIFGDRRLPEGGPLRYGLITMAACWNQVILLVLVLSALPVHADEGPTPSLKSRGGSTGTLAGRLEREARFHLDMYRRRYNGGRFRTRPFEFVSRRESEIARVLRNILSVTPADSLASFGRGDSFVVRILQSSFKSTVSIPNGLIIMTDAEFDELPEGELFWLIAHEIGHILNFHALRMDRMSSDEMEYAADDFAMETLARFRRDYDIRSGISYLVRIARSAPRQGAASSRRVTAASTDYHPPSHLRIRRMNDFISRIKI